MVHRVTVVPACTDLNRGDQMLVWETVEIARKLFPSSDCRVVDTGETQAERELQSNQTIARGIKVLRTIVPHPSRGKRDGVHYSALLVLKMAVTALVDFIRLNLVLISPKYLAWLVGGRIQRETIEFIRQSTAVFVKGGGFLHVYGQSIFRDFYYIWHQTYYIQLAERLGIPVVVLPNSFGPFDSWPARQLVRYVLRKCAHVFAREPLSLKVLKEELNLENCSLAPDLAYFAVPAPRASGDKQGLRVAVTVRPYRFPRSVNPKQNYEAYIGAIAEAITYLVRKRGAYVSLVVQVKGPSAHEDDFQAISDVLEMIRPDVSKYVEVAGTEGDAFDLVRTYAEHDVLIGTRFHSVIFSHLARKKALAITYGGNKGAGIMQTLGLSDYSISIYNVTGTVLIAKLEALLSDATYVDSLDRWFKTLPGWRVHVLNECAKAVGLSHTASQSESFRKVDDQYS